MPLSVGRLSKQKLFPVSSQEMSSPTSSITGDNDPVYQSNGYNLVGSGDAVVCVQLPGDQVNIADPMLGPLADNGGPTKTHAPLPGSPAIDAGDPAAARRCKWCSTVRRSRRTIRRRVRRRWQRRRKNRYRRIRSSTSTLLPAAAYGDFNLDGQVDAADYVVWRMAVGQAVAPYSSADGSGNGSSAPKTITSGAPTSAAPSRNPPREQPPSHSLATAKSPAE